MISYSSNGPQVYARQKRMLQSLQDDKSLRTAALDGQATVQSRVQQRGLGTAGNRISGYSKGYAKQRRNKGRQTSYVDLTMQGDLWRNWIVAGIGRNEYGVGFRTKREGDKSRWLEDKKGLIFHLSTQEIDKSMASILRDIDQKLRR